MVTAFPIQSILDRPGESIGNVLPISAAGVTVIRPGVLRRDGAASDAYAGCFAELQTELGECPSPAAYHGDEPHGASDLRHSAPPSTHRCSPHSVFPVPAQRPSRG